MTILHFLIFYDFHAWFVTSAWSLIFLQWLSVSLFRKNAVYCNNFNKDSAGSFSMSVLSIHSCFPISTRLFSTHFFQRPAQDATQDCWQRLIVSIQGIHIIQSQQQIHTHINYAAIQSSVHLTFTITNKSSIWHTLRDSLGKKIKHRAEVQQKLFKLLCRSAQSINQSVTCWH